MSKKQDPDEMRIVFRLDSSDPFEKAFFEAYVALRRSKRRDFVLDAVKRGMASPDAQAAESLPVAKPMARTEVAASPSPQPAAATAGVAEGRQKKPARSLDATQVVGSMF